jgi:calcineurin-like phosphoesterase family protein
MSDYFSADFHLGHVRILELADRPFGSVDHMNSEIIRLANEAVGPDDRLFLLGDIVMGRFDETVELLTELRAGKVFVLPGNHDRWSLARVSGKASRKAHDAEYRLAALDRVNELDPGRIVALPDRGPDGWGQALPSGREVLLSHYPYEGDHTELDRHVAFRPRDRGLPLVCGHVHGLWRTQGRMLNVGVDQWAFKPVPVEVIERWVTTHCTDSVVV